MFPINCIDEIRKTPEQFKLVRLVSYQNIVSFPHILSPTVGDEILISVIDSETTGLSAQTDEMIEFGWVRIAYSLSQKCVTSVIEKGTMYQQPSVSIPAIITEITGITDEMVMGKRFDLSTIKRILTENVDLVVAHNAKFDKGFVDASFSKLLQGQSIQWACSIKDIDWKARGYPSSSLELLLMRNLYWYSAHRADTDCLALSFLLADSKGALDELIGNANTQMFHVKANRAPFDVKDALKVKGFSWDTKGRVWHKKVPEQSLDAMMGELDVLYTDASLLASVEAMPTVTQY